MKRMRLGLLIICMLIFNALPVIGQTENLDSTGYYQLAFNMTTRFNVVAASVLSGDDFEFKVRKTIINKTALNHFSEVNLIDSTFVSSSDKAITKDDLDARMVLLLYESNQSDTLVMDKRYFYYYEGEFYRPHIKFLLWLNEYAYLRSDEGTLFSKESANQAKLKNDFMGDTIH